MDRVHLLLLGLPLFLFCSDLLNLFTPPPPRRPPPPHKPSSRLDHHAHHQSQSLHQARDLPDVLNPKPRGVGYDATVNLNYCASCSYRGTAMTMKRMLETAFPGIDVIMTNHPPTLPKRLLSKVVPIFQVGVVAIVMAGDQIFPRLGFMTPPSWYFSLRTNRFGAIATTWLLGNFMQSFLQSSGAFEVYCNGELVFSKLREHRFPSEFELKDLIGKRLADPMLGDRPGVWS